jgi:hypothetical protein
MKRLLLLASLGFAALFASPAKAQVNVNVNIGSQPSWGPSGYDHVDYYYLPEVESYYYVPSRTFIYLNGNRWVKTKRLPARYQGYDLHRGRKVVINAPRPYLRHNNYRSQYGYASYSPDRVSRKRVVYRDYPEVRHNNRRPIKQHTRPDNRKPQRDKGHHGNGHGAGHGNGHGRK